MQVMVIVKASESSESGQLPDARLLQEMGEFNQKLIEAGVMKAGDGLKPSSEGFRVRFSGTERVVTRGPFPETNELIAGYWVWEVASMEDAIEWVKKCPNPMQEDSDIEIRPYYQMADFADVEGAEDSLKQEGEQAHTLALRRAKTHTYLFFGGRCQEALDFYSAHLGAKVGMKMSFADSPDPVPEEMLEEGFEDKIMHAEFTLGDATVFASDGCISGSDFSGFSLTLTVEDAAIANKVFDALAQQGEVLMPLEKTFWAALYGQVKDQFGVTWMVMVDAEQH